MATYYTLLTKIGQASIANAVALNQKVNLTYMAVGDGNGNPTTPNENQTALVREKYRATINQLTVDADNPSYLIAEMIIPTTVGGWSVYEVGVFNDQNQLIAVANFPATYKPELAEGSGRDLIVRIVIQVSNTSVVTLKIDPAITLASQAWVAANYVKKITMAGGTTGQILAKKSNANEDFQWVAPTAAVDVNVFSREETQTLASGQTIVNLAQLTTDGAAVYVEGIRLRDNQFTVNSPTRLTLATSYPANTKVTIVQNEETSRNAFTLKANNLSDLTDKPAALVNLGLGAGSALPVGVPIPYPLATPPTGWLKCNGSSFNKTSYPQLALAYPSGVLPDLRGEFIRGWDDGRGVDSGRSLLSAQNSISHDHRHFMPTSSGTGGDGLMTAVFTDNSSAMSYYPSGTNEYNFNPSTGTVLQTYTAKSSGYFSIFGDESRPRNLAFNYIVRAA